VIVIAHRLSTIRDADKIVVLEKGEVKEEGSHQELIAQEGVYRALIDKQLTAQAKESPSKKKDSDSGEDD